MKLLLQRGTACGQHLLAYGVQLGEWRARWLTIALRCAFLVVPPGCQCDGQRVCSGFPGGAGCVLHGVAAGGAFSGQWQVWQQGY